MTAKEYLNQVHVMDSRIETLEHTIDEIWTQLTHITADPSKDVAPVVHAYNKSKDGFLCSACTFGDFGLFRDYTPKYCPNCGAKMDEVVENG